MKKALLAVSAAAIVAACSSTADRGAQKTAARAEPAGMSRYIPDENLLPVGAIPDAVIHDPQRNKDVAMSVEYPTRGGPYPVIILSHAWGASKDDYTALSEYWAGHGYICIKPSHADAGALRPILAKRRQERRAEMEKQREAQRHRWDPRTPPEKPAPKEPAPESLTAAVTGADLENRAKDISFVIDSIPALEQKYPEIAGKMRRDAIGVAGHSLGALTAMLVAGAVDFKSNPPLHAADSRVKALLAMSPPGIGPEQGLTAESFRAMKIPAMYMSGSLDQGIGAGGDPKWRHDAFANSPAGDKFFVSFNGARSGTFAGTNGEIDDAEIPQRTRQAPMTDEYGRPIAQPQEMRRGPSTSFMNERRIFGQVKAISSAFFDAYLKNEPSGHDYMKAGGTLDALNGTDITVERK